jgi:hypothetical protein
MKTLIALLLLPFHLWASEVPSTPPNPCYEGCTPFQENLVNEFMNQASLPEKSPAVYSGVCHHLGMYNPEVEHHSVVLLDEVSSRPKFATIFSWFYGENSFRNWTLETARQEMSPYWDTHGSVTVANNTARVVVSYEDGNPAYVYWMRQNPRTKELLYITYMGIETKAFCRLKKHPK